MKVGRGKVGKGEASIAALLAALLLGSVTGCSGPGKTFKKSMTLGGKKVSARRLNNGEHLFLTYCSACHGVNGDGKGPASVGLRPPPRNFQQGQFKFAAVASGQLPIPGMGGALTVPKMGLGKVTAKATVKEGKLVFDRLESRGDDLEATGEGLYCVLQPRLAFAPIFGKAKVRIREAFWSKSGARRIDSSKLATA